MEHQASLTRPRRLGAVTGVTAALKHAEVVMTSLTKSPAQSERPPGFDERPHPGRQLQMNATQSTASPGDTQRLRPGGDVEEES